MDIIVSASSFTDARRTVARGSGASSRFRVHEVLSGLNKTSMLLMSILQKLIFNVLKRSSHMDQQVAGIQLE
ncbi:hypothetical protein ABEW19_28405 [Paenibacillus illinoisensis]